LGCHRFERRQLFAINVHINPLAVAIDVNIDAAIRRPVAIYVHVDAVAIDVHVDVSIATSAAFDIDIGAVFIDMNVNIAFVTRSFVARGIVGFNAANKRRAER
jgi:hypothetical protein